MQLHLLEETHSLRIALRISLEVRAEAWALFQIVSSMSPGCLLARPSPLLIAGESSQWDACCRVQFCGLLSRSARHGETSSSKSRVQPLIRGNMLPFLRDTVFI